MRTLAPLILLLFCVQSPAQAQGQDACGDLVYPDARVERLFRMFTEAEYAPFRESMNLQQLPGDAGRGLVTDQRTCRDVAKAVESELKKSPGWRELDRNGYRYKVLFFGPYYAAVVLHTPPAGVEYDGYARLMVFSGSGFEYLGSVLV